MTPIQFNALLSKVKKENKPKTVSLENGLTARINKAGIATFAFKVKQNGKTLYKTLGTFPQMSLAQAKMLTEQEKAKLTYTDNPMPNSYTVEDAFNDWAKKKRVTCRSYSFMEIRLQKYLLPKFGKMQLAELTPYMLISAWAELETAEMYNTLKKLCSYVKDIAILAVNTGKVGAMADLSHITSNYPMPKHNHFAAMTPQELPDLFYAVEGQPRIYGATWQAMMCQFFTLSRPNEIACMKWKWVDFDREVITFPEEIMKRGLKHEVPMSRQLKSLLLSIPQKYEYVFISPYRKKNGDHINAESVRLYFSKCGLGGKQSAHGIRSIGSTWLAENGYPYEESEMCLAHVSGNAVRLSYMRSDYLEKRRKIMQDWCDYVEDCRMQALKKGSVRIIS